MQNEYASALLNTCDIFLCVLLLNEILFILQVIIKIL